MSIQTVITATCDLKKCRQSSTWKKEEVERNESLLPEEAKYLVMFNQNGVLKTFCCQLHAAEYFLPPGYEAKQKQVIELPAKDPQEGEKNTSLPPWLRKREPEIDPDPVISRHEDSPENGLEGIPI
jgi:hypothetical protein